MNIVSKGMLTVMALALDFAAGSAIDHVVDITWINDGPSEVAATPVAAPVSVTPVAPKPAGRSDAPKSQPGGGVCKPSEHSVMVMEIDRSASQRKVLPRHVCVRALSGEPDFSTILDNPAAFVATD